jgi:endonuclease/exonuclease/phosphatase family metal-dependent hydrolase
MRRVTIAALAATLLSGCGAMQGYNQTLEANQNAWTRSQKILDERNQIDVNKLQAIQRQQQIEQARAEGAMEKAKAAGQADAAVETARGEAQSITVKAQAQAQANRLLSQSLTALLVQDHFYDTIGDKTIIYAPSNALPFYNVTTPGGLPSERR